MRCLESSRYSGDKVGCGWPVRIHKLRGQHCFGNVQSLANAGLAPRHARCPIINPLRHGPKTFAIVHRITKAMQSLAMLGPGLPRLCTATGSVIHSRKSSPIFQAYSSYKRVRYKLVAQSRSSEKQCGIFDKSVSYKFQMPYSCGDLPRLNSTVVVEYACASSGIQTAGIQHQPRHPSSPVAGNQNVHPAIAPRAVHLA